MVRLVTLKRLAILYTLIWFFDCMSMEVYGQVTRLVKRLFAHCVHSYGFFTCVSTEVHGQVTRLGKRLSSSCTLI